MVALQTLALRDPERTERQLPSSGFALGTVSGAQASVQRIRPLAASLSPGLCSDIGGGNRCQDSLSAAEPAGPAKVSPEVGSHARSQRHPETPAEHGGHPLLYSLSADLGRLGPNWLFLFVGAEGSGQKPLQVAERGSSQKHTFVQVPQRLAWDAPLFLSLPSGLSSPEV